MEWSKINGQAVRLYCEKCIAVNHFHALLRVYPDEVYVIYYGGECGGRWFHEYVSHQPLEKVKAELEAQLREDQRS